MIIAELKGRKRLKVVVAALLALVWCQTWADKACPANPSASKDRAAESSPAQPDVHGVWFADGDDQRTCIINQKGGYFHAIDEQGRVSSGRVAGPDLIEAYGALGRVSPDGKRIDWGFGIPWMRNPRPKPKKDKIALRDVSGRWYAQGDRGKACRITQAREVLQLIDQTGRVFPGKYQNEAIEAFGKIGYLAKGSTRIEWSDGTYWTRKPQTAAQPSPENSWPDLSGNWYAYGDRKKICTIEQQGNTLRFMNEIGTQASGHFLTPNAIESNGFRGYVSPDHRRIDWINQTWWVR